MKYLLGALLCFLFAFTFAQTSTDTTVDVLRAPISPAFQLLGVNPTEIERPTTPTDFVVSIAQGTNNLSTIPLNISMVICPKWLFETKKNRNNFENFKKNSNVLNNIFQSLIFSLGTATTKYDSTSQKYIQSKYNSNATQHTSAALGIKFSLCRGKVDPKTIASSKSLKQADSILSAYTVAGTKYELEDKEIVSLKMQRDSVYLLMRKEKDSIARTKLKIEYENDKTLVDERMDYLNDQFRQSSPLAKKIDSIKQLFASGEQEIKRYGFKLDIASGFVLNFPTENANFNTISKVGVWMTGGWDDKKDWGLIGMVRFSYNPDLLYQNQSDTFLQSGKKWVCDLGGKLYGAKIKKLSLSGEFLARVYLGSDIKTVFKYSITADYEVAKNKYLSFTLGKDFAGPTKTGGSFFGALNTALGIGSTRPLFDRN